MKKKSNLQKFRIAGSSATIALHAYLHNSPLDTKKKQQKKNAERIMNGLKIKCFMIILE